MADRRAQLPCRPRHGLRPPPLLSLFVLLSVAPGTAEPQGPSTAAPSSSPGGSGGRAAGAADAESRALSCLAAAPSLAWYLNGERQEMGDSSSVFVAAGEGSGVGDSEAGDSSSSSFVVTTTRPLNCSATDPASGRASSASVLLNVQFRPELVKMDVHYQEGAGREPGLLLVLFVLVEAHPAASITWVDQDGRTMVNTSRFLIVDAKTYPWLTNHTVQLQLSSVAHNVSFRSANPGGITNSSLLQPGLLGARVELPLLALVVGTAVATGTFLCLGALVSCLVYQKTKKVAAAAGLSFPAALPLRDSNNLKSQVPRMSRAYMSLPSNLQLNDLTTKMNAQDRAVDAPAEEGEQERALSEPENSLVLVERGLGRFPMVGYIYRASSTSSDEIWL